MSGIKIHKPLRLRRSKGEATRRRVKRMRRAILKDHPGMSERKIYLAVEGNTHQI